jgi:riboflavin synthase
MFTGLVMAIGCVRRAEAVATDRELEIDLADVAVGARLGDSICIAGVCCTLLSLRRSLGCFRLSPETLARSTLGRLQPGELVNLEPALTTGQPLGGHFVQGHVDGVAEVVTAVGPDGGTWLLDVPEPLTPYIVEKGPIALDGVSLTVAQVAGSRVSVAIIPHTATRTTIGCTLRGARVNVEVDLLAKYVAKALAARHASS